MLDIAEVAKKANLLHPKVVDRKIEYGTAGFRTKGADLDSVVFRMGILGALRSKNMEGAVIGMMITASHNPEEDNGVKLVDPMGEMLSPEWETTATLLANSSNDSLAHVLHEIITQQDIDMNVRSIVYIASDTRCSSPGLSKAAADGAQLLSANIKDYGYLTTPQLHYMVRCTNTQGAYGDPSEEGYYQKLGRAFVSLNCSEKNIGNYSAKLKLDGANGVGALKMKLQEPELKGMLCIESCNTGNGRLNYQCGADFVKIQQKPPEGMVLENLSRCASFDGDGDRLIYFYLGQNKHFHMLDGDKIAALVTGFLKDLVVEANLDLNILMVQTAYANGNSTKYISEKLGVTVACVSTGVKHLHHKAQEADVGIYFEANGHGTVVFSDSALDAIAKVAKNGGSSGSAAGKLRSVINLINQTVGDAISDMLLVETVLHHRGWSVTDWDAIYKDLPNRQLKVVVKDRNAISTTDAERKCVLPVGLQESIDQLVKSHKNWRAFVRPSGTEDIVRVYAEADTQEEADKLASAVSLQVYKLANGVGPEPK